MLDSPVNYKQDFPLNVQHFTFARHSIAQQQELQTKKRSILIGSYKNTDTGFYVNHLRKIIKKNMQV